MAIANIVVLPGSPQVAKTVEVNIQGVNASGWELYIDDVFIDSGKDFKTSIAIAGKELELANFGHYGCDQKKNFTVGESFRIIDSTNGRYSSIPLHVLELRLV